MIQTIQYVELNAFALVVLFLIYWNISHRTDSYLTEQKLFLTLLWTDGIILVLDTAMWALDGRPGAAVRIIYLLVTVGYYILNPLICLLWFFYVDYQVFRSERRLKKLLFPMSIPFGVNCLLAVCSVFAGVMFYLDGDNVYHRGSLFPVMVAINFSYLLCALALIVLMKKRLERHHFIPVLAFFLPPVIGGVIQTRFYGISIIWVSTTISLLILFLNIQNYQLDTDYLTGVFNRRQLDQYLLQQSRVEEKLLAGIMIDVDAFKMINDKYGHDAGDEALKQVAGILKKTFRKVDFIARYGGDEFVVIMELTKASDLNGAVFRLKRNIDEFNTRNQTPYRIGMSLGYDVYTPTPAFTVQAFLKHIDGLMYEDKARHTAPSKP